MAMFDKIIKQAHKKLTDTAKTLSLAESCTGGLLSCLLTEKPGSSKYFLLGVVAYSNKAKELILNIPADTIAKHGAVSRNLALLMAKNVRKKINSDFGLSITGIAGPAGASVNKPVGTVFIALSYKNKNICRRFTFAGSRRDIRKQSAQEALRLLCAHL